MTISGFHNPDRMNSLWQSVNKKSSQNAKTLFARLQIAREILHFLRQNTLFTLFTIFKDLIKRKGSYFR